MLKPSILSVMLAGCALAHADLTVLTSRSELVPSSDLAFGQFGADGDTVNRGAIGLTTGCPHETQIRTSQSKRVDQGTSWSGHFGTGEQLLQVDGAAGDLDLMADEIFFAAGLEIERKSAQTYRAVVSAYDGLGSLLGTFTSNWVTNDKVFIGVRSDVGDPLELRFNIEAFADSDPLVFAVNHVSYERDEICCDPVPEPATLAGLAAGCLTVLRKRKQV